MGYSKPRVTKKGKTRYTAVYLDGDNIERSAGTFGTKTESDEAWKDAEGKVKSARGSHLIRGRQTFKTYVEKTWLPNLDLELTTIEGYTYTTYAHLMDHFGEKKMLNIFADDIREWKKRLKNQGMSARNRQWCRTVLSSILTSAVDDQVILSNPCLLVKADPVPTQPIDVVTPEDFDVFYYALPEGWPRLLVEVAIETGMRWGELSELRPKDFDFTRHTVTVTRAVVYLSGGGETDRGFHVKTPKNGKWRRFKINCKLSKKIQQHVKRQRIGNNDLIFRYVQPTEARRARIEPPTGDLGRTAPNDRGRRYQHGTTSAYTAGKCRCKYCRSAMAQYRSARRADGKDQPRKQRTWSTDGHIPRRWFREHFIKPALIRAGIARDIRMHLLRHAHASWLLNGGADLLVVKERLGHSSITTTEQYLHTLDNADETAIEALELVRNRASVHASQSREATTPAPAPELGSEQLQAQLADIQSQLSTLLNQKVPA